MVEIVVEKEVWNCEVGLFWFIGELDCSGFFWYYCLWCFVFFCRIGNCFWEGVICVYDLWSFCDVYVVGGDFLEVSDKEWSDCFDFDGDDY